MNNTAFRSLINSSSAATAKSDQNGNRRPPSASLGSRSRPSMPMAPRSLYASKQDSHSAFKSKNAEQTHEDLSGPPTKKLKTNSVPKGSKFALGYVDRSAERRALDSAENDQDDKQERLKALEVLLKKDEIDQETFDKLRQQLGIGGDTSSTHLVKGLDWKLLERVRKGEDVSKGDQNQPSSVHQEQEDEEGAPIEDVDDELQKALEREATVPTQDMDATDHDGQIAASTEEPPQQTLSRDEILRRLKANRKAPHLSPDMATSVSPQPALSSHFKKIASAPKPGKHKFTESINGRRREVLVITNKDGSTKRKTRWIDPEPVSGVATDGILGADVDAVVLAQQKAYATEQKRIAEAEADDDDIFGEVAEYNPLADLDDEPSEVKEKSLHNHDTQEKKNYFATGQDDHDDKPSKNPAHDPEILAALKRAAHIRQQKQENDQNDTGEDEVEGLQSTDPEALAKRQAFLKSLKDRDRQDALDIDMGFGSSRFDDEEEEDGVVFNEFGDDNEGERSKGSKNQRKRGGKKRKGDKNSARDVLGILEGRQQKG